MELREIRTFLHVAQFGSFSKAAKYLDYSQAAVTIQIKQLEQELGTHLFDRIGKQTVLTHQGTVFYDYAARILHDISCAKDAVSGTDIPRGELCIGTIESICASIFPRLLEQYHRSFPEVSVRIVLDSPDVLLDRMNKNTIDLVYLLDKRMYDPKWIKVLEEPEEIAFVTASSHPFAGMREIPLEAIIAEPFILTEKNASYRYALDQYLASLGKRIHPFLEIGNTEFIVNLLKTDSCLSFLPKFAFRAGTEPETLSALSVKDFSMQSWRQILYHKDKWVTREMSAFIETARAVL